MIQLENAIKHFNKIILIELYENNINCWIAGGSIRDYFNGIKIKTDYDLFFPNNTEFDKCLEYFKSKNCNILWNSENGCKISYNKRTFDLVKKYFNTPQETIDAFDFTVAMFAIDKEKVYYGATSFIDLAKKQLMINSLPLPLSTLKRAFRYYSKGYFMCAGEMKKLCTAIQNTPIVEESGNDDNSSTDEIETSFSNTFVGYD